MAGGQGGAQINERDKAIQAYYDELARYEAQGVEHEGAVRSAFQNLLSHYAQQVKWTLVAELTLANGARPDGVLRDRSTFPRGYWEAKDTRDDLEAEISKKAARGYPLTNTIFEDTRRAILFQNDRRLGVYDLRVPRQLADLLRTFFDYEETVIEAFETAVEVFRENIPTQAAILKDLIERERREHQREFEPVFQAFYQQCRDAIDPKISEAAVIEMLIQHLLTERLFREVFNNPDFTRKNVIAVEIEKVIDELTKRSFNRTEFLRRLDPYYTAIARAAPRAAIGGNEWADRQHFLNMVYERFFQDYSVRQADTHGIVYTPPEIVEFMVASVDAVLKREFGMAEGIGQPGVKIVDPATGTGNYIVHLLRHIPMRSLRQKYTEDLFCNEIMLLPYYIACLNIEHAYYERTGEYLPFEGACFADTLDMAENVAKSSGGEHIVAQSLLRLTEANTARVDREQAADIMVVIGNPPYNVGQVNENDNNKNREYPVVDRRIRDTYAKDSTATLKAQLYDAYVKFFRWATDRLQGRDGIVCLVSNNSFVDQITFDGMRKHLLADFTAIYHLDLHGNVRQNPKLSGTTHNVFGIQVGVGITIAIRRADSEACGLYYYRVPEDWRRERKLSYLAHSESMDGIEWQTLTPDTRQTWLTEGLQPEFSTFLMLGSKEAKFQGNGSSETIFSTYCPGVATKRDSTVYDFDRARLAPRITQFVEDYNAEVARWVRSGRPEDVDGFLKYDRVKWSNALKVKLRREHYGVFEPARIRRSMYRPYCAKWLYYSPLLNDGHGLFARFFPSPATEAENMVIVVTDIGYRSTFNACVTSVIPDLHLLASMDTFQCFPYYVYDPDGSNRRENITEWALGRFREAYGAGVTKRDIFHYVYGLLHHPAYRERYAENLKRELPRIPLVAGAAAFQRCAEIGRRLMELHLSYERQPEHPALRWVEHPDGAPDGRVSFRVEKKMRVAPDRTALAVNDTLTIEGIPAECFAYRLGNRSALEWVIDQYHVSEDKRSGIISDPNRGDDPQYIARLVGRVVTVSVETVRLVRALAAEVALPAPVAVEAAAT